MLTVSTAPAGTEAAADVHAASAVSWGAIFAGAVVAVAATTVLLELGAGFGLASVSPWAERGISPTAFTVTTAIWLVVTQWLSSGFGGYLAGRLRKRWIGTHTHEVFFRDTAHGFVTWALASAVVAIVVAGSAASLIGGSARTAADVAGPALAGVGSAAVSTAESYSTDKLFRNPAAAADAQAEAGHILSNAIATGSVPDADQAYLAAIVAQKSGVSQDIAKQRVDELVADANAAKLKAKEAADAARKVASASALFAGLSMLIGAFVASVSAALGGRQRDMHT